MTRHPGPWRSASRAARTVRSSAPASISISPPTLVAIGTPARNSTRAPATRATLAPGTIVPSRFAGSLALEAHQRIVGGSAPHVAHLRDRVRQRELLAGEAGDEAAAADLAARFEAAIDANEIAPLRQPRRLALEQAPADDAVAAQQDARDMLDRVGVGPGCGRASCARGLVGGARRPIDVERRQLAGRRGALRIGDQRPASATPSRTPPRRRRDAVDARFAAGTSSARKPAKLSQLIPPRTTSSASASSSSAGNRRTASAISSKNDAPCVARCAATRRAARAEVGIVGARRRESSPDRRGRRGSRSTGVERSDAPALLPLSPTGRSRVHSVRPAVHSSSSQALE
jgi:hypothetical protein